MTLSVFDMYSIGIGPSSSHTVGPMRAASLFVGALELDGLLERTARVRAELFGSLGATGRGHGSDRAVLLGLMGEDPETVDLELALEVLDRTRAAGELVLGGRHAVPFDVDQDLVLHRRRSLPGHSNGMQFTALDADGQELRVGVYYSVGGGFVVGEEELEADHLARDTAQVPHPFTSGEELLQMCAQNGQRISDLVLANELTWRSEEEVRGYLLRVWQVMQDCVDAGCTTEGTLPGGLHVPRRAAALRKKLRLREEEDDQAAANDWINLYALAVNEENAGGGRVVTAPTNGAAGIIPAVLHYYTRWVWDEEKHGALDDAVVRFLLTAAAIGMLCKMNASISGAEVGCQGEVGSASAMAAAGLCEVVGGTPEQVENAAEIGIEHNLGLTCDPIGGLVQVPCIERNAMGSIKSVNAVRLAMHGDGTHFVSLDQVLKTMADTGRDMHEKYKETAEGGLAVNVIEC